MPKKNEPYVSQGAPSASNVTAASMAFWECRPERVATTRLRSRQGPAGDGATASPMADVLEPNVEAE